MKIGTIASVFAVASSVEAFAPSISSQPRAASALSATNTRRDALAKFGAALSAGAVFVAAGPSPAEAKLTAEEEEYNELISMLKARSEANKEANANYARRSDKLSSKDFKDIKNRPKLIVVQTSKGNKLYSSDEFKTLDADGKIKTEYGTRMKQGGGEMTDYTNVTYTLVES